MKKLAQLFLFQGYKLYFNKFYTSPTLLSDLLQVEVAATGTLNTNRRGVPMEVIEIKDYVDNSPRGTGYYL